MKGDAMNSAEARFAYMASILQLIWVDDDLWVELVTKLALATDEEIPIVVKEAAKRMKELI